MLFSKITNPLLILVLVITVAAVICIVAFLIYKFVIKPQQAKEEPVETKDEATIASENLNRLLKPVDEDTAKQMDEYDEQNNK